MSLSRVRQKVKTGTNLDWVKNEVVDDSDEEKSKDGDYNVKSEAVDDEDEEEETPDSQSVVENKKKKSNSESTSSGKSKRPPPPPTYETFKESNEVTLHIVIRDAHGNAIKEVPLQKHQFNSGSYGWTLDDKAVVDDGQGGEMTVSLHSNCVIQGSKKKARAK